MAKGTNQAVDYAPIDCDFHTNERQKDIFPYLNSPFDELVGRVGDVDMGYGGSVYPKSGFLTPKDTGSIEQRVIRDVDDVRDAMEMLGTDKTILSPGLNMGIANVHHDDLAHNLAIAHNDWNLDTFLDDDPDIYSTILVTPKQPRKAADEIDDRAHEEKLLGVFIGATGVIPPLGHDRYEPIYEVAQRHDLPIVTHPTSQGQMIGFSHQWYWTKTYLGMKVPSFASDYMFHLATLLTNGIPEKFPDLEFVMMESGLGWIPYFLRRFDHLYNISKYDAPHLEKTPSDYVHDRFYFTSQPIEGVTDREYISSILELIHAESNLMFASDYPHNDFDFTDELLKGLRSTYDTEDIRNIYRQTAETVYGL